MVIQRINEDLYVAEQRCTVNGVAFTACAYGVSFCHALVSLYKQLA